MVGILQDTCSFVGLVLYICPALPYPSLVSVVADVQCLGLVHVALDSTWDWVRFYVSFQYERAIATKAWFLMGDASGVQTPELPYSTIS